MTTKHEALRRLTVANSRLPHLRLGQLIFNAITREIGPQSGSWPELFYAEDEQLVQAVERYVQNQDGT